MRGRIKEDDESVPVRRAGYYYYTRTLKDTQYRVGNTRVAIPNPQPPTSFPRPVRGKLLRSSPSRPAAVLCPPVPLASP